MKTIEEAVIDCSINTGLFMSSVIQIAERSFKSGVEFAQGWKFDFSDVCHLYWVKSRYGQISEYYALDKTSLRSILLGSDNHIVELI